MNKTELIARIARENPKFSKLNISNVLNLVLDEITEAVQQGEAVKLTGFGAFSLKTREEYKGRHPQSGAVITIKKSSKAHFTPGKHLKHL